MKCDLFLNRQETLQCNRKRWDNWDGTLLVKRQEESGVSRVDSTEILGLVSWNRGWGQLEHKGAQLSHRQEGEHSALSACCCWQATHPLSTHPSIHIVSFLGLCQSDCRRCLCLRVRIKYLKSKTPQLHPFLQTPGGSDVCFSSLLPPTDHYNAIVYCATLLKCFI